MTHTPGPWTFRGEQIHSLDYSRVICYAGHLKIVALTVDFNAATRDAEVDANARLIAAAPDLLAALKAVSDGYDNPDDTVLDDAIMQARDAIEKAEGDAADGVPE